MWFSPPTGGKTVKLFSKKNKTQPTPVQTAPKAFAGVHPFSDINRYSLKNTAELSLYSSLREAIPLIDGAINKIVRLVGDFEVKVEDSRFQLPLDRFLHSVRVTPCNTGLKSFIYAYLDQLLTYGTAVGEIVPYKDLSGVGALYNTSLRDVSVVQGDNPLEMLVVSRDTPYEVFPSQEMILCSLLDPTPGTVQGKSLLKGLPFVSSVLLRIFGAIGNNWERAGNIRYAVTYKPQDGSSVNARQRAKDIAEEWSKAMRDDSRVCDFVAVGDVSIKVIGADGQVLDCDVPIKHILEQIVSKLSIPPFLLGLSWSSTERMSSVQADILTSELEYYRSILDPVIRRICKTQLRFLGSDSEVDIIWSNILLQDEVELAEARLKNAQAQQIESSMEVTV